MERKLPIIFELIVGLLKKKRSRFNSLALFILSPLLKKKRSRLNSLKKNGFNSSSKMWLARHQWCSASWALLLAVGEGREKRDEMGGETKTKWRRRERLNGGRKNTV